MIDMVFRRSEGIPYFVEELTRSAARGCIDMPDTLRDALNVRVLSLSDRTQQTLQLAAVAGNRVDHGLLGPRPARRMATWRVSCGRQLTRPC